MQPSLSVNRLTSVWVVVNDLKELMKDLVQPL